MKQPSLKIVFDRKKVSTKKIEGLVQIEIYYNTKRRFFSTGVHCYKDQWNIHNMVVNRADSVELNEKINCMVQDVRSLFNEIYKNKEQFSFNLVDKIFHEAEKREDFLQFAQRRIDARNIADTTRSAYNTILKTLKEFGGIVEFSDLTVENITLFDAYLYTRCKQASVYTYHQKMKIFTKDALMFKYIKEDPYVFFRPKKGVEHKRKYLTKEELDKIRACDITNKSVDNIRDCFIFQSLTGLAYADLQKFDWNQVRKINGKYKIMDVRQKTDIDYSFMILPEAYNILKKHHFKLRIPSITYYNEMLEVVAIKAGINKTITSHMARHSAATLMLNSGVRIETVSKILGHTNIKTTAIYAKITDKSVEEGFEIYEKSLKKKDKSS